MEDEGIEKRPAEGQEVAANKRLKIAADAMDALERQELDDEKKRQYFMTYGVGYSLPHFWRAISYKTEPLDNESLLGRYKLVYFASTCRIEEEEENGEWIHRTARGTMELSIKRWSGQPALFGTYAIDTRKSNGEEDQGEASLGNYTSASFIENVIDWNSGRNSKIDSVPNAQPSSLTNTMGRKDFVLDRYPYNDVEWWQEVKAEGQNDLDSDSDSDSDFEYGDGLCHAVLKIVAKRFAMGLDHDYLRGNHYCEKLVPHDIGLMNLEVNEKRMKRYRNGRNSWICRHLRLPADVAFRIRQFVTPPPAFFLEEGDLVLVVEESKESDWTKTLIFRKVD